MIKLFRTLLAVQPSEDAAGADLSSLRDITGIETLPALASERWPHVLALALAALAGLGFAGWLLRRRRWRPGPPPPADAWALQELARLEALRLPEVGKVEAFHTALADVIRTYLELRFKLHAPRRTTLEFFAALEKDDALEEPQKAMLRDLLERCDLAKFARAECSPGDCRLVLQSARDFVQATSAVG